MSKKERADERPASDVQGAPEQDKPEEPATLLAPGQCASDTHALADGLPAVDGELASVLPAEHREAYAELAMQTAPVPEGSKHAANIQSVRNTFLAHSD